MEEALKKGARWLAICIPVTTALAFSAHFQPAFSAPKDALLMLMTAVLAAEALCFSDRWKLEKDERLFGVAVAAFLAIGLVSALISQCRPLCLHSVTQIFCGVLLFAAVRSTLVGEGDRRKLQTATTLAAVLVSLITVAQFCGINLPGMPLHATGRMRIYATLGNPDFVAAFLAIALPGCIGLSIAARRLRGLLIAAALLMICAAVLTGSRGGLLALTAGAVVFFYLLRQRRGLLLIILAAASVLIASSPMNDRGPWESLRGRVLIWQVSLGEGAALSPLGSGPGSFSFEYPLRLGHFFAVSGRESLLHFAGPERHAQNDFVELWHDTGWLGLGSLLALLGAWFALALRRLRAADAASRPLMAASLAAVSAFCVAALWDFPMHRAETWAMLWLCMAAPLLAEAPTESVRVPGWKYAGAGLLIVAGSSLAFAPLAASYELARGESEEDQGSLPASVLAYRAALRWEPSSPDANFALVRALAETAEDAQALEQSKIAQHFVNEPELFLMRSRILQNAGHNSEALREVESAARVFPYSVELRKEVNDLSLSGPKR